VIAENAERRIGEPDRIVGLDDDVVGRVERLAVERVDQHRVVFGARDAPAVVLAADEATLPVARVAVGEIRRPAVNAGASGPLIPAHDSIIGNIAPKQTSRVTEINRALAPAHAGSEPLDARVSQPMIGMALARLPAAERGARECRRRGRAGGANEIASREFHGGGSRAWLRSLRIVWPSS